MKASMSRRGNCDDNAPMESFWGSLKNELVHHQNYPTRADTSLAAKRAKRSRHSSSFFNFVAPDACLPMIPPCRRTWERLCRWDRWQDITPVTYRLRALRHQVLGKKTAARWLGTSEVERCVQTSVKVSAHVVPLLHLTQEFRSQHRSMNTPHF
ncbi:MAG: integrase [Massilia sp.]|jgi:transposase InsO family protein|nr:integrase [Massilia sp.]